MANAKEARPCAVCGKSFSTRDLVPGVAVRDVIANEILREHSDWSLDRFICRADLNRFRSTYVHNLLESEKGDLTTLEHEVRAELARSRNTIEERRYGVRGRLDSRRALGGSDRYLRRQLDFSHLFCRVSSALDRFQFGRIVQPATGPLSIHFVEPDSILLGSDSSPGYYDEPEPPGGKRSATLAT